MKAIEKFQADDGTEFLTAHDAMAHEKLCHEVFWLMNRLRDRPALDGCDFENGAGYVRQVPGDFLSVQADLARIIKRYFKGSTFDQHFDFVINGTKPLGQSFLGRLVGEGPPSVVSKAWWRISCTDDQFREWGQPYYAAHPSSAKQVDLTDSLLPSEE